MHRRQFTYYDSHGKLYINKKNVIVYIRVSKFIGCLSLPSPESHTLCISAWNHAKSILQLAKNSFIFGKCQNLSRYNSPRDFWHLAKNISNNFISSSFPPLVQPDGTNAISSIFEAELFAQTFAQKTYLG